MPEERSLKALLIVNADDYGRFACTSRGILDAARHGMVTAAGVLANADALEERLRWLDAAPELDVGIHLTLTSGRPLSGPMRARMARYGGGFPTKYAMLRAIASGAVSREEVLAEWRAQIERLSALGVRPNFINSHEHLHMFPPLYRLAASLADRYGIDHLRHVQPPFSLRALGAFAVRDLALAFLGARCAPFRRGAPMGFLGLEASGRLDRPGLEKALQGLKPGGVYELMCHPGYFDPNEIVDPQLRRYHDWEGELEALTAAGALDLLKRLSIRLIRFKDLRPLSDDASALNG